MFGMCCGDAHGVAEGVVVAVAPASTQLKRDLASRIQRELDALSADADYMQERLRSMIIREFELSAADIQRRLAGEDDTAFDAARIERYVTEFNEILAAFGRRLE